MKRRKKQARRFSIIATVLLIFSLFTPAISSAEASKNKDASPHTSLVNKEEVAEAKINSNLAKSFEKDEKVTFLIKFKEKADPVKVAKDARTKAQGAKLSAFNQELVQRSAVISELKATAISSQQNVVSYLESEAQKGHAEDIEAFYIVNAVAVTATKEVAEKIANFPEVEKILPNEKRQLIETEIAVDDIPKANPQNIEWNVDRVNAPSVWGLGIDGAGTVVANIDTGVDWQHPALKEKYRGYNAATGEVDHTYSFFDPVNGQTVPYDNDGHGTHTMGTMVGSEPNGSNQVGVAPGAKWIAVQAFTDDGAYDRDLIAAGQWIMEPGGDASKAPDVVNNSWGGGAGINEFYQDIVIAWRAAEIFPAFAAGNTTLFNPGGPGSVATPANYPESFAVGATDSNDMLANFSLRGPSPYGEIKPEVSAPGVAVRSAVPGGGYSSYNGTSMAAPAVAGVVALLRSADSSISVDYMEQLLMDTAVARTDSQYPESPNHGYGHGIVDAFAAVSTIAEGLGSIEGQVTMDGEDTEAPEFEYTAPSETYAGLDLELSIHVSDNVSITSVQLQAGDELFDAERVSGNYKAGEYVVTVPGDMLEVGTFTYNWIINDFGNNEVVTDEYSVEVKPGITNGYYEDFEENPLGWQKLGSNNTWEWGAPTSGPEEAFVGENVYATNVAGPYVNNMDAHLVMPPIDVPEGDSFLQFKSWHEFEISSSGTAYDYGNLAISTDLENWTTLEQFVGSSDGWSNIEADLRDYQGQRVYIGFYTYSDGSVTRDGWYIDEVTLTDESQYNNDSEPPTFEHTPPEIAYSGMALNLDVLVRDNMLVGGATLHYQDENGDWQALEAELESGSNLEATFSVVVPGNQVTGDSFTYKWEVSDYAGNTVESDEYVISLTDGITVGYFEDFENNPQGWTLIGSNNVWELGEPTSGPNEAVSGENVYATKLDGQYPSRMDGTLIMPGVQVPDEGAYLQFKSWHEFEQSSTGRAWDYGEVVVSTNMSDWTTLAELHGSATEWQDAEVDLSEYAGQTIYVGFYAYSDASVERLGWYIDDVALADSSLNLENNPASKKFTKQDEAAEKEKEAKLEKELAKKTNTKSAKDDAEASVETSDNQTSGLPLEAIVSVLENGRSVSTNPQDGTYKMTLPSGAYTLVAETYGFRAEEQSVTVTEGDTATANFVLEELPKATVSGTVTSEQSGNPIVDATLLLVEDANVEPVKTDENGNFSITAYEGTYTLKVIAQDYKGQEMEVTFDENKTLDIALEPFFTIPGGEIGYDDGTAENARVFYDAGNGWAVKMSLPEGQEQAIVTDGVFQFHGTDWPTPGGTGFAVEVWSAGADGLPAEKLAGPIEAEAIRDLNEWTVVDLREHNIQVDGDFYMVYIQTSPNPNAPGLATDENGPNAGRSYQYVGGSWSLSPADEGNYMIRARVAYGVDKPEITSPADGTVTNEATVTVEGTASPTTTVSLLNNDTELGTAEIGEDGSFSFDIELEEGQNNLQAVTYVNDDQASASEVVTVTLDTIAPELNVVNVEDGQKTNRETLTVQGTVHDDNLSTVTVNGQEASVEDGEFSKRIMLDEGENTIEVVATDAAGNTNTQTFTVYAKFTAPEITNLTPAEDQHLHVGQSVQIEFDSEPGLKASFVVQMPLTNLNGVTSYNPIELPLVETTPGHYVGYWTVPSNVLADGAVIEVKVRDSYGNETRQLADGRLFITEQSDGNNSQGNKGTDKEKGNNGKGKDKKDTNKGKGNN